MSLHSGRMASFAIGILLTGSLTSRSYGQTLKATILGMITDSTGAIIPVWSKYWNVVNGQSSMMDSNDGKKKIGSGCWLT